MTEADIKGALHLRMRQQLLGFVVFRHEDKSTYGIPDTSVTHHQITSWWEAKHADPDFKSHGQQELNMRRLGNQGFAFYVIYEEFKPGVRSTRIVHPRDFINWKTSGDVVSGFDHDWVIAKVREIHK